MGKYSCVCVYMEIVYVNVSEYVALQLDVYIYSLCKWIWKHCKHVYVHVNVYKYIYIYTVYIYAYVNYIYKQYQKQTWASQNLHK